MKINKNVVIPVAVGITSFGVGFASGYFLHKKRNVKPTEHIIMKIEDRDPEDQLRLDFQKAAENQEENRSISMSRHPANQKEESKEEPESPPLTLVVETDDEIHIIENVDDVNLVNVFTNEDSDWDYEVEVANRDPEKPYIIHRDEFYEPNDIYEESSLMYYEGDDILVDSNDIPIYDKDGVVGELRFGHGSHDPSIVYIRNEPLKAQFEVIIDHGYFAVEVLGAEIEDQMDASDLKHSNSLHKFRD